MSNSGMKTVLTFLLLNMLVFAFYASMDRINVYAGMKAGFLKNSFSDAMHACNALVIKVMHASLRSYL
jgi:hypothetical protein